MKKIFGLLLVLLSFQTFAITADEVLKKVDYNMTPTTVQYDGKMIITQGKSVLTKEMKVQAKGSETALIEFTSPVRDKGTKMLRTEENMYIYFPSAEKTQKLSGHMLRQGIMGSDFSYEDQTSRNKMTELYSSKIVGETENSYTLELVSKPGTENTYYKRVMTIDKKTFTIKNSLLYANSGKLLKEMVVEEYEKIGDRYYSTHIKMIDKVKTNSYTEIISSNIKIDVKLDDSIFSLKNLEKKN